MSVHSLIAGFSILFSLSAISPATAQQAGTETPARRGTYKDGVARLNGDMILIEKGKQTVLQKVVTMKNGTTVKPDGTVITPGGKPTQLKEGMAVNMQGRIVIFRDDMFTPETISDNTNGVGYQENTIILEQPDTIIIRKK